jgi:hypothetical protein
MIKMSAPVTVVVYAIFVENRSKLLPEDNW